jgi:hypothetical protein
MEIHNQIFRLQFFHNKKLNLPCYNHLKYDLDKMRTTLTFL